MGALAEYALKLELAEQKLKKHGFRIENSDTLCVSLVDGRPYNNEAFLRLAHSLPE